MKDRAKEKALREKTLKYNSKRRAEAAAKRQAANRKRKREERAKTMKQDEQLEILGAQLQKTVKEVVGVEVIKVVKKVCDERLGQLDGTLEKLHDITAKTSKVMKQCCEDVNKLKNELQQVKDSAASYMQSRPPVMYNPPSTRFFNPGRRVRPSASNPTPIAGTNQSLMERSFRDFMRDMMMREQFY